MPANTQPSAPLTHRIERVVEITGASRTKIYEALKFGHLEALKIGRSTLIPDASVRRWLANLPRYAAKRVA